MQQRIQVRPVCLFVHHYGVHPIRPWLGVVDTNIILAHHGRLTYYVRWNLVVLTKLRNSLGQVGNRGEGC